MDEVDIVTKEDLEAAQQDVVDAYEAFDDARVQMNRKKGEYDSALARKWRLQEQYKEQHADPTKREA